MADFLLAIDQGTTSTRAIVFDRDGRPRGQAQRELPQIYPRPGRVEHDPERIWADVEATCRGALHESGLDATDIAAIGITNQRETVVVWERATGRPVHNAIVWQDRRTADLCARLARAGHDETVRAKTGLLLDPYFSATKLTWLLDNIADARARAERGELVFGTVDSFLLWRLSGSAAHATDATNAARTLLYDIHAQRWDPALFDLFEVPAAMAPEVRDNAGEFATATADLIGREVPVLGMAGDQQAAAIGQACLAPGLIKATYGTGAFILLNTGDIPVVSRHRLLTTLAYRLDGRATYAVEGSIFAAGAAVQWLRDGLGLVEHAAETEALAATIDGSGGVYLVPAFAGLGAPYWDPEARGALLGLTRASGAAEVARAALESVAYQTHDILAALAEDGAATPVTLRVDGGMVANDWLLGFLADLLDIRVERPRVTETTALGAAMLAGLGAGFYDDLDALGRLWRLDRGFDPDMPEARRRPLIDGWRRAVAATRAF